MNNKRNQVLKLNKPLVSVLAPAKVLQVFTEQEEQEKESKFTKNL